MKRFLFFSIAVVGFMLLIACDAKENNNGKPIIKIGLTLPLTGNAAIVGKTGQKAFELAFNKWKNQSTKYNYDYVIEDDMLQLQKAASNATKLVQVDKVNAIVSLSGVTDRIVDKIANDNQVISMTCSLGKTEVPEYGINNTVQNKELAELLIKKLREESARKIAVVTSNTFVGISTGDYVVEALKNNNFEISDYEKYAPDTKDVRISIAKMEKAQPDFYLFTAMAVPLIDIVVKQFEEITGKKNFTCIGAATEMQPNNFHLIEGIWVMAVSPCSQKFEEEYHKKTGLKPVACTASTYDNADLLIWAYENTPVKPGQKIPDNKAVLETLKNVKNWHGATGTIFIDKAGIAHPQPYLQMYQDGKFIRIE